MELALKYLNFVKTSIVNNCIQSGVFPDELKLANVILLYKGGPKHDPNNYRPISILPTLSKIFERHIVNQLIANFQETNLLHERQSGFRQFHSC